MTTSTTRTTTTPQFDRWRMWYVTTIQWYQNHLNSSWDGWSTNGTPLVRQWYANGTINPDYAPSMNGSTPPQLLVPTNTPRGSAKVSVSTTPPRDADIKLSSSVPLCAAALALLPLLCCLCLCCLGYRSWISHLAKTGTVDDVERLKKSACCLACCAGLMRRTEREWSLMRGISLDWFLEEFEQEAGARRKLVLASEGIPTDKLLPIVDCDFYQLREFVGEGDFAFGSGIRCPRDRMLNCSIVDAVFPDGHSARATVYVSWAWCYTLDKMRSALENWDGQAIRRRMGAGYQKHFLWWCFFSQNLFRMSLDDECLRMEANKLSRIIEEQLIQTGRMLIVIDQAKQPVFYTRLWCLFEVFTATENNLIIEAALSSHAKHEFEELAYEGIEVMRISLHRIRSEKAQSTSPHDSALIKSRIKRFSSYEAVDDKVRKTLAEALMALLGDMLIAPMPAKMAWELADDTVESPKTPPKSLKVTSPWSVLGATLDRTWSAVAQTGATPPGALRMAASPRGLNGTLGSPASGATACSKNASEIESRQSRSEVTDFSSTLRPAAAPPMNPGVAPPNTESLQGTPQGTPQGMVYPKAAPQGLTQTLTQTRGSLAWGSKARPKEFESAASKDHALEASRQSESEDLNLTLRPSGLAHMQVTVTELAVRVQSMRTESQARGPASIPTPPGGPSMASILPTDGPNGPDSMDDIGLESLDSIDWSSSEKGDAE